MNTPNGSETFHRHALRRNLVHTDGVEAFAKHHRAYWFIDAIALGANGRHGPIPYIVPRREEFAIVILTARKMRGKIELFDDQPGTLLYRENIAYTDLPDGEWRFYLANNGTYVTLLLPTEY